MDMFFNKNVKGYNLSETSVEDLEEDGILVDESTLKAIKKYRGDYAELIQNIFDSQIPFHHRLNTYLSIVTASLIFIEKNFGEEVFAAVVSEAKKDITFLKGENENE